MKLFTSFSMSILLYEVVLYFIDSPKNVSPNPTLLGSIKQLKLKQRDKDENSRKSESGLV